MDKSLIYKMIESCFRQYHHEPDALPLNEDDYKTMYAKIIETKEHQNDATLHDIINDVVYEFLTT